MKRVMEKISKILVMVLILNTISTLHFNISFAKGQEKVRPDKTQILVKYKDDSKSETTKGNIKKKLKLKKLSREKKFKKTKIELINIDSSDNIDEVVKELKKDSNVEYAQPNYELTINSIPEDQRFAEQWALQNNGQEVEGVKGRSGVDINALPAWDLTKGSQNVVIGLLDTGIDINHSDLKNNIFVNTKETTGNAIDDDGNGYIDDVNGWDFTNGDSTVYDSPAADLHGTQMAGIIAAGTNSKGISGTAPNVKILPLKFINERTGYTCDAIDAIEYAMSMGVKIINCSFGGSDNNYALMDTMKNSGILFICAAGNRGGNVATYPVYPACFNIPNILSVASLNNNGVLDQASGYGSGIQVAAPGVDILTTTPESTYGYVSGTSAAAANVTGVAALVKSYLPNSTITDIQSRIKNNVTSCAALQGKVSTGGRVNAYGALTNTKLQADSYMPEGSGSSDQTGSGEYGQDLWYTMDQLSKIKEKLHYGESGVNPASGNYSFTVNDMSIAAPGFQVNISRTYNSKSSKNTPLGRGWTFGFEGNITGTDKVWATLPNGSVQCFILDTATNKYTADDSRSTLVKNQDGTFILTTKDQYSYGFNVKGWLNWMKDRSGNVLSIDVDDNGKISKITDTASRQYTITYNSSGLIDNIKDPLNRVTQYKYDSNKLLTQVIDPMGKTMNYTYDGYGYITEVRDNGNNLVEKLTYNHNAGDTEGRVTDATDAYGDNSKYTYDILNRKTTIIENGTRTWVYWFDPSMYTVKTQDPEGKFEETEYYLTNGMNKFGDVKSSTDRNGNNTLYEIDDRGNVTKITNPDGSFKVREYDSKNNLIKETDELSKVTYYIYDTEKINLLKKVQPLNGTDDYTDGSSTESNYAITTYSYYSAGENGYTIKGLLKSVKDPEDKTTTYEYDSYGNITKTTDPSGKVTINHYNSIGWVDYSISPNNDRTDYTYDSNGLIEKTVRNNGAEVTRVSYDDMGRVLKEISPKQYRASDDNIANHTYNGDYGTRYSYYPNGLLKTVTDAENNTTAYGYDIYGNKTSETKPNGAVYIYEYDVLNRLVKEYFKENKDVPDSGRVLLKEYSYAVLSDGKTQKKEIKYITDTEKAECTYIYDYAGRLVEQQNPDGSRTLANYNSNGTVNTTTAKNGSITFYKYDGLNRLTEQWTPFEVSNGNTMYTYSKIEYDKSGRKTIEKTSRDKVLLNNVPQSFITTTYDYYDNGKVKKVCSSDGRKTEYEYDGDGNILKQDVYTDTTHKNTTEYTYNHLDKPLTVKLHVKEGDLAGKDFSSVADTVLTTENTYDANGNLDTVTTPNNITTTYTYDNLNNQTGTSQPGQNETGNAVNITTAVTYNWEGKPLSKTDAKGNTTYYTYDQRGFLTKVTDAKGGVTAYWYDRAGRKIAEVSPKNYSAVKDLSEMNRTEYAYDLMDRVKTKSEIYRDTDSSAWTSFVSKAYQYDLSGNIAREQDALGYESGYGTEYTYNLAGKLSTMLDPASKDRALPFTTKYEYDGLERKISETNAKGIVTAYTLDDAGNVLNTVVNSKKILESTYDLLGNELTQKDGNGNTTCYEYNVFNEVRKTVTPGDATIQANTVIYQYDIMGRLANKEDSLGCVNKYTYDNQGRVLSETERKQDGTEDITTSTKYDVNGNKRYVTDGNGVTTENVYDGLNRLTSTSTSGKTTSYGYDANGNKTSATDWRGNTSTSLYDPLNRLVEKRDAYGKLIQKLEYNHNHVQVKSYSTFDGITMNVTEYRYDKNNRLITTIDPDGHITSQSYDNTGNIATKTDGRGITTKYAYDDFNRLQSVTNAKSETTGYTYDLCGNMLTKTDGNGNTTTYEYNTANKLVRKTDQGGRLGTPGSYAYADGKSETYTYYQDGSLKTKTDRNGKRTDYTYDIHGRMLSQAIGDNTVSYTYDNNGNQLTMTDSTGTTVREYDDFDRVTSKTVPNIGKSNYTYDTIENDGCWSETTTDPKGNATVKVYDKTGRLWKVTAGGKTTTYDYYDNGSRKSVTYPDGSKETYTYYKDNLNKTLENKKADGSTLESYSYTYDSAHNQTSKTDAKGVTSYIYDSLNRLQKVTEPSGRITGYTYDKAGNRLSETVTQGTQTVVTTYTYDRQNRLVSTIKQGSGTKETDKYTYDDNGNMLSKAVETTKPSGQGSGSGTVTVTKAGTSTGSGITFYEYDVWNQLAKTTEGSTTSAYAYNGEGYRVQKTVNGQITRFLYEADKVVLETDGSGNQTAANVYGTNQLMRSTGGDTLYYMYNGHADVTALLSADGTVKGTYYYDAFGTITEQSGNVNNSVTYAGYQYDKETGLYYLNSRMYDSKIARFLQEDTYAGDPNDPLSLNLYTYCLNNPLIYDDPTGHMSVSAANHIGDCANTLQQMLNNPYLPSQARKDIVNEINTAIQVMTKNSVDIGIKNMDINNGKKDTNVCTIKNTHNEDLLKSMSYKQEMKYGLGAKGKGKTDNVDLSKLKPEDVTRKIAEWLIANPVNVYATQHPYITQALTGVNVLALFYAAGFVMDGKGVYHARQEWSLQSFKYSGYNDFYDTVFHYATDMDNEKFQFCDKNGNDYILWAWKGDYLNLGAGAEMGIYKRMVVNGTDTDHWLVDKSLAMPMTLKLDYKGKQIISYDPKKVDPKIFDPLRKGTDKWWVTGFNPDYQDVKASQLTATYTVTFNTKTMYDAFYKKYGQGVEKDSRWTFDSKKNTAKFKF